MLRRIRSLRIVFLSILSISKIDVERFERNALFGCALSKLNECTNFRYNVAVKKGDDDEYSESDADTKAAAALSAASEAQDVRDSLDALRVQGENRRTELEGKQDQLQSDAAKQAVQTVLLQSKIDDANRQYAQQQADAAGSANPGQSAFRK